VNKGSGDFFKPFDVELKAVSNTDDALLVYTLDGSEPTATNGTQTLSGTLIHIDGTTTLKVGLLVNGAVSGIITRTYTYQEAAPSEVVIPDFCTVAEGEICAFFEAPIHWTNTICCWAWTDSPSDNFTGGSWPGAACELLGTAPNGNTVWKWTWDGKKQKGSSARQPAKIIFNNNGQPQTNDLAFQLGGYYNKDGLQGTVSTTGIQSAPSATGNSCSDVYDLQGRRLRQAPSRPGVYIQNGKLRRMP
jgi:alpha-amylase